MARYAARHLSTGDPARDAEAVGASLRDRLTQQWLVDALGGEAQIVGYDAAWWDGAAYDRCVVVDLDGRRLRVVETEGEAVVVPVSRRAASRVLARRRQSRPAELPAPEPRPPERGNPALVVVEAAEVDAVRCPGPGCGALRPVGDPAPCPRCGTGSGQTVRAR